MSWHARRAGFALAAAGPARRAGLLSAGRSRQPGECCPNLGQQPDLGGRVGIVAIGLTMTFSILRFANFSHASMAVVGAYLAYF